MTEATTHTVEEVVRKQLSDALLRRLDPGDDLLLLKRRILAGGVEGRDGVRAERPPVVGLEQGPERRFTPYDRFAQFHESQGKSLGDLLEPAVRYARDHYHIVLIGHEGHDEVVGTMGEAPEAMVLVEWPSAEAFQAVVDDPEHDDLHQAKSISKRSRPSRRDICRAKSQPLLHSSVEVVPSDS